MKFHPLYLSFLLLLALGCQPIDIPSPQAQTDCTLDYTNHPRNATYQQMLQEFTGSSFVGISLLVDHPQEGLWIGGSGWADIENEVAMTPCHLHYASSIFKSYLAVVVLQLEEEGKLHLDDPISDYLDREMLDRLPNGQLFTIRELLQCRSGMPDVFETEFLLDFLNHPTQQYQMEELMEYLYGKKAVSAPGERFYYGDGNFILLSMLVEKLDGKLQASFDQRIFQELGTSDSYLIDVPDQLPSGVAASYWDRHGNGQIQNVSESQIAIVAGLEGTDGLIASVNDLNQFLRGIRDGRLLSSASFAKMLEFLEIPDGDSDQNYAAYGLGIARVQLSDEVWYGSFGNNIGSSALMLYNPLRDVSIVAAQNTGTFFNDQMKEDFFGHLIIAVEQILF